MRTLGVIPARQGSKGVPGKNLRPVGGEPLIVHSIRTALASRRLDAVLLTTDGDEIAAVARSHGCPVLRRPQDLAGDETPMVPVMIHALEYAEGEAEATYEAVVLLQPTAPIRTSDDIDTVISMLEEDPQLDSVISLCPMDDIHPARMYRLGPGGEMEPLWPDWEGCRRQDLPVVYYRNGALYAVRRRTLLEEGSVYGRRRRAYVMPEKLLANVDTERDLMITDLLVRRWLEGAL